LRPKVAPEFDQNRRINSRQFASHFRPTPRLTPPHFFRNAQRSRCYYEFSRASIAKNGAP
jgi:hypothetical protein